MPENAHYEERRARISAQVRQWCEQAAIAGRHAPLSDAAAVLIAAGHVDAPTRQVLTYRRRAGRTIPTIGGFGALRLLTDEYNQVARRADTLRPGPAQLLFKYRATELGRKLQSYRSAVVMSTAHYGNGVRAMRRDRREGVHLDLEQRESLFRALQRTPAPVVGTPLERAGNYARGTAAERIGRAAENTRMAAVGRRVAEAIGKGTDLDNDTFADGYDTLLYLAGMLFDRIDGSPVWHSEHFAVQRHQLDLAEELTQIAVDTVALRGIRFELDDALRATHSDSGRHQVEARRNALKPVWDQLVDRVAALARIGDLLSRAEVQLRSVLAVNRAMSLDSRIDELIARSGDRELSAENTHYVGDQFGGVEELMLTYQSALYGDIAELTSWGRA
ncbi:MULTISPECIES: hypothetical protein [unclassified Rhodococcus (in: high G+C Gram-positive bacteria)]|uniref:hypothetical protein n=1 Tax=unclassified Rhodococcus (in: high G+C Gram-positive bacteria) TaxID=192944 RepID=UPI0016396318|nr:MULTISPECIES: hypothetical protein [unclassified Rhodococcus (in: high G+C Gram-positive bacteria)]MBC2639261.1 hypothetical protein [Rhodococcus sp. 3A]MBC2895994.1 hypothetical protein [Rhodococcus sp. 4CII]